MEEVGLGVVAVAGVGLGGAEVVVVVGTGADVVGVCGFGVVAQRAGLVGASQQRLSYHLQDA